MIIERLEDGSELLYINGYYREHLDSAMDGAIGLAKYARDCWRGLDD